MLSFIKNIFKETLRKACRKGDIEAVKQHLAAGADVNAKEGVFGTTPLHLAAKAGHKESVALLITAGADVNARTAVFITCEETPLHCAAYWGHKETVELLIAAGADVNAGDKGSGSWGGRTPVDVAMRKSSGNLTRLEVKTAKETTDLIRKHGGKTGEELKAEGN